MDYTNYKLLSDTYFTKLRTLSKELISLEKYFQTEEKLSGYEMDQIKFIIDNIWTRFRADLQKFILQNFACNIYERIINSSDNNLDQITSEEINNWLNVGISIGRVQYESISDCKYSISAKVESVQDRVSTFIPSLDNDLTLSKLEEIKNNIQSVEIPSEEYLIKIFTEGRKLNQTWDSIRLSIFSNLGKL